MTKQQWKPLILLYYQPESLVTLAHHSYSILNALYEMQFQFRALLIQLLSLSPCSRDNFSRFLIHKMRRRKKRKVLYVLNNYYKPVVGVVVVFFENLICNSFILRGKENKYQICLSKDHSTLLISHPKTQMTYGALSPKIFTHFYRILAFRKISHEHAPALVTLSNWLTDARTRSVHFSLFSIYNPTINKTPSMSTDLKHVLIWTDPASWTNPINHQGLLCKS